MTEGFRQRLHSENQDVNSDTGTRIMINILRPSVVVATLRPRPYRGIECRAADLGRGPRPFAIPRHLRIFRNRLAAAGAGEQSESGRIGRFAAFHKPPTGGTASNHHAYHRASQVPVSGGTGFVVYEVVDANPNVQESAQIPTFIALPANTAPGSYAQEAVTLAPLSTVGVATMTDPVPRFVAVTPPLDCMVQGDCSASYYPHLKLNTSTVTLAAASNGTPAVGFVPFINSGGGTMQWTASSTYQTGSGWLSLSPTTGVNASTVNVHANPAGLAAGTYNATITIDAGPAAGSQFGSGGVHGGSIGAVDHAGVERGQRQRFDAGSGLVRLDLRHRALRQQCLGDIRRRAGQPDLQQCDPDQLAGSGRTNRKNHVANAG